MDGSFSSSLEDMPEFKFLRRLKRCKFIRRDLVISKQPSFWSNNFCPQIIVQMVQFILKKNTKLRGNCYVWKAPRPSYILPWLVPCWLCFWPDCHTDPGGRGNLLPKTKGWNPKKWRLGRWFAFSTRLGGGFKNCLFSPLSGEDSHFD